MANIKELSARAPMSWLQVIVFATDLASMAVRQVLMGSNDYDVVCASYGLFGSFHHHLP